MTKAGELEFLLAPRGCLAVDFEALCSDVVASPRVSPGPVAVCEDVKAAFASTPAANGVAPPTQGH